MLIEDLILYYILILQTAQKGIYVLLLLSVLAISMLILKDLQN